MQLSKWEPGQNI